MSGQIRIARDDQGDRKEDQWMERLLAAAADLTAECVVAAYLLPPGPAWTERCKDLTLQMATRTQRFASALTDEYARGRDDEVRPLLLMDFAHPDRAVVNGQTVVLTDQQFCLLAQLAVKPGEVLRAKRMICAACNPEASEGAICRAMARLRAALRPAWGTDIPELIQTVGERGYRLCLTDEQVWLAPPYDQAEA